MTKLLIALILGFGAITLCTAIGAEQSGEKPPQSPARVGTYDSRAVAIAYARSETFDCWLKGIATESEKAKAAEDTTRLKELEAEVLAQHELAHKQVFSVYPVGDILEQIKDKIPHIADQAGVDIIVSKWEIVYRRPGIEFIDVTDLLVEPFGPDEDALKLIDDIRKMDPVPLEESTGDE
jgi:hypothetical protein